MVNNVHGSEGVWEAAQEVALNSASDLSRQTGIPLEICVQYSNAVVLGPIAQARALLSQLDVMAAEHGVGGKFPQEDVGEDIE